MSIYHNTCHASYVILVILNEADYVNKVNNMIDEGTACGNMLKQVILHMQI